MLGPESDTERSTKGGKDFSDSAQDSGFISGHIQSESDSGLIETPKEKRQQPQQQQLDIEDSGIIDDSGVISDYSSKLMPGRNEVDKELSKKFGGIKLDNKKQQQQSNDSFIQYYEQDEDGDTDLHIAIVNQTPRIVSAIIQLTPDPNYLNIKNDHVQAPIHLAAITQQSHIVRHLLIAGASASIRDGNGNTPLHLACANGDITTVMAILARTTESEIKENSKLFNQSTKLQAERTFSIDLEQRNFYGEFCIHIAAEKNHLQILKMLICAGANVNAREGRAGYTPLHIAVENNNEELVKFLLENTKIDKETLSYGQLTAYQLIDQFRSSGIQQLLRDYGCEPLSAPESDYSDSDSDSDDSAGIDSDC